MRTDEFIKGELKSAWRLLTHPIAVVVWFALAILVPMYISYLDTSSRYVVDFHLLFFVSAALIGVAWLMNMLVMPVLKVNLIIPLLGVVSYVSLLSDIGDEVHHWAAFQWHVPWLDGVIQLLLMVLFVLLIRGLLRRVTSDMLLKQHPPRFWLLVSLPFLLLLSYKLFSSYQFFADAHGRVAVFHKGLSSWIMPGVDIESIDEFIQKH